MSKLKILISSIIFISLTVVKFVSPAIAHDMRGKILPTIDKTPNYKEAMVTLGDKLSDEGGVIAVLKNFYNGTDKEDKKEAISWDAAAYSPMTLSQINEDFAYIAKENAPKQRDEEDASEQLETAETVMAEIPVEEVPAVEVTPAPVVETVPEAVATFLASQEKFADQQVPEDVSYQMPDLPFAYASPVAGYTSSGFGFRLHPILEIIRFHYGTDFAANTGEDILSFADGTVITAGQSDSYGLYLIIDHGDGYKTLYAHCSKVLVTGGDKVVKGQKIGYVGMSGEATGPHLHFELIENGTYLNPEFYLQSL